MLNQFKEKPPFNGVVKLGSEEIQVTDGVGEFDGMTYFVSKDGNYVMDMNRQVVAKIRDGQVTPLSAQDGPELVKLGIIAPPKKGDASMLQPKQAQDTGMLGVKL